MYICSLRLLLSFCFFFFSSRRRHTRLQGDWSSDVCSSDLEDARHPGADQHHEGRLFNAQILQLTVSRRQPPDHGPLRSEERRVGKGGGHGGGGRVRKKKE